MCIRSGEAVRTAATGLCITSGEAVRTAATGTFPHHGGAHGVERAAGNSPVGLFGSVGKRCARTASLASYWGGGGGGI